MISLKQELLDSNEIELPVKKFASIKYKEIGKSTFLKNYLFPNAYRFVFSVSEA